MKWIIVSLKESFWVKPPIFYKERMRTFKKCFIHIYIYLKLLVKNFTAYLYILKLNGALKKKNK